ncbi:MAG TPA: MopE-related protein [Sandaracinaceae bacterium LLY-WYZ-13_1]|nr:MopE-related protein [Sandaracinaceae bacterium LLY-WYZ-13_1]
MSLAACSGPAGDGDAATTCAVDPDCDDGVFCNGAERCAPDDDAADARGCVAGPSTCPADDRCLEEERRCERTDCDPPDLDGDGVDAIECGGEDCDDREARRRPGATEVCDGADDDCDGAFDEGTLRTFYRDADGDDFGDPASTPMRVCAPPSGWVENDTDCDDEDSASNPGAPEICDGVDNDCDDSFDEGATTAYYRDADGDGYGDAAGTPMRVCTRPPGWVDDDTDCDDDDPDAHPGPPDTEVCDGADNDCDGTVDNIPGSVTYYIDLDGDGYGTAGTTMTLESCDAPSGYARESGDCDDDDAGRHPGAPEPCDGVDANCSGDDEDEDDDGHYPTSAACTGARDDCDDSDATAYPGAVEACDGADDDCDLSTDEGPVDDWCGPQSACDSAHCVVTRRLAAGSAHTCFVASSGRVMCWGDNDRRQLGDGTRTDRSTAGDSLVHDALAVSSGRDHVCAARVGGTVSCWGLNFSGQVGLTPTVSEDPSDVSGWLGHGDLALGLGHSCAAAGSATCWGSNARGQLGDGSGSDRYSPGPPITLPSMASMPPAATFASLAAGDDHTCGRSPDAVLCWGDNGFGQLGDGTTTQRDTPVEVSTLGPTADGPRVRHLAAGGSHACVVLDDGTVRCWGNGGDGRLGTGSDTSSSVPVSVTGLTGAVEVAAGASHTCARTGTGEVWCWGQNSYGQLGDGTTTNRSAPVAVSLAHDALEIAAGYAHTCARVTGERVFCWGRGLHGQLGHGSTDTEITPVEVMGLPAPP